MSSSVTESVVEGYLCRRIAAVCPRALVVKHKPIRVGWPDRSVYWPGGVHHLIETKRPKGGRYEPLQKRTHDKLRKLDFGVWVILTKQQVDEYIGYCLAHDGITI